MTASRPSASKTKPKETGRAAAEQKEAQPKERAGRPGPVRVPGLGPVEPKRLLWLGGLAVLAAFEVIEWPVAIVIGAGTYVAERLAQSDVRNLIRGAKEGQQAESKP
ncbi:hypothetical protein ABZ863_08290 [Saccharomonospora sp. NPDC046836]|uniref:hypothetical protein n=1 Tax=Saccharomonospora sp. NPDC046836 TaxID=3156921 RepID=UPI0033CFC513